MNLFDILSKCDHTLLRQDATWDEIKALCDDALRYKTASVCIPPCFVADAKAYTGGQKPICTVIGFPNGYHTTAAKVFETADAVKNGADEIDMVINLGDLKMKRYKKIADEIAQIKAACDGRLLKVIVETCLLTEDEKITMSEVVSASPADYIKTSTGFSKAGAIVADIALFARHMTNGKKIKAAGGIHTLAFAEQLIDAGASRLGASALVKCAKEAQL